MRQPKTPREALTLALFLAITASTEEQSERALKLADELSRSMHADDVRGAMIAAKKRADRVLQ